MMVKEKNSLLFFAGLISLFSFGCLIVALNLPQKSSPSKVLGVTTPISNNLVPCSVIENWQKQYCSTNIGVTSFPTRYNTPTPVAKCSPSATLITTNVVCKTNSSLISYATYRCQNGSLLQVGDFTGTRCYDKNTLYQQALNKCATFCTPNPTPTTIKITPTSALRTSFLNISQDGACSGNYLTLNLSGNVVLLDQESNFWGIIKDESTGKSVIFLQEKGIVGSNPINGKLATSVTSIRPNPNYEKIYLIGDGRNYTFSFYTGNYTTDTYPTFKRLIYQTKFSYICPGFTTPTKAPTTTPSINSLPDLIISKAYIPYPPIITETWNYIGLEIKNIGTSTFFTNTNIKGDITDYAGKTTTCEVGLGTVKPGETQTSSLHCIAYTPGPATITIKIDEQNRITESNENNNVYKLNFYVSPKN